VDCEVQLKSIISKVIQKRPDVMLFADREAWLYIGKTKRSPSYQALTFMQYSTEIIRIVHLTN